MRGATVEATLKESLWGNFWSRGSTFANQPENQRDGILHGSKRHQPFAHLPGANRVGGLQPVIECRQVELTGSTGYMAAFVDCAEEIGLPYCIQHLVVQVVDSVDEFADFDQYAVQFGRVDTRGLPQAIQNGGVPIQFKRWRADPVP